MWAYMVPCVLVVPSRRPSMRAYMVTYSAHQHAARRASRRAHATTAAPPSVTGRTNKRTHMAAYGSSQYNMRNAYSIVSYWHRYGWGNLKPGQSDIFFFSPSPHGPQLAKSTTSPLWPIFHLPMRFIYILFKSLRPIPHTCRISTNCLQSQPIETADRGIAY